MNTKDIFEKYHYIPFMWLSFDRKLSENTINYLPRQGAPGRHQVYRFSHYVPESRN